MCDESGCHGPRERPGFTRYYSAVTVTKLALEGALSVRPEFFRDDRGSFAEIYAQSRYAEIGLQDRFIQDNLSRTRRGALRGLHGAPGMAKLVQVLTGEVYDVIVDLRHGSPTYLRWLGLTLRAQDGTQIYVPDGFVHGFLALSDDVTFLYKQTALYDPHTEFGVAWNDPDLAIAWPLDGEPLLSAKDATNPTVRELGHL